MCDHKQEYHDIKRAISELHREVHDMSSLYLALDKMHNEYVEVIKEVKQLKGDLNNTRQSLHQWIEMLTKDYEDRFEKLENEK